MGARERRGQSSGIPESRAGGHGGVGLVGLVGGLEVGRWEGTLSVVITIHEEGEHPDDVGGRRESKACAKPSVFCPGHRFGFGFDLRHWPPQLAVPALYHRLIESA